MKNMMKKYGKNWICWLIWIGIWQLADLFIHNNVIFAGPVNMAVTLAYAVFIGPVSEEMIFRGAIFDRFYIGFDYWVANILQAALFGLYHMNLVQGLYAFCLGIVLGVIVKATGSILCSMLTHIIFNGTSYILPIVLGSGNNIINIAVMFVLFVIAVLGIFGIKTFTGAVSHSN